MKGIKKILVAIDLSEYSAKTMEYAADLADILNAELIVGNIINQRDVEAIQRVVQMSNGISVEKFIVETEKERNQLIQELMEETSCTRLHARIVFHAGVPFVELIKIVEDEGADLVVMGTKGRSNLANVLLGSTAEKMFSRCPVPLLSVRLAKD